VLSVCYARSILAVWIKEEKREVLLLSHVQDLKYKEVAEILGCDPRTVKVRANAVARKCSSSRKQ